MPILPRPSLTLVFLVLGALATDAQRLGESPRRAAAPQRGAEPARPLVAGLRGIPSAGAENEADESDPPFDFKAGLRRSLDVPSGASASAATTTTLKRLVDHPRRAGLADWLEQALRGKEIDVALLGGHKYMINSCLGIKVSAGKFRLKLENPSVRFDNTGIVLTFAIDRVSLSAVKLRMRPNPNPVELCKFSKKFEVGGDMDDVRLTLRLDPLYDPERCRIGLWHDANPEVRIGNLNLKPLQNDLDRMAKDMVEDALTFALQVTIDGMLSALGDQLFSAVDQFLEADCPTKPGETGRQTTRATKAIGGAATGASGEGGASMGAEGGPDVQALLARIVELEGRIAELEAGAPLAGDLEGWLGQAIERLEMLEVREVGPELRARLVRFLRLLLEKSALGDPRALLEELTGSSAQPEPAGTAGPWTLVPNPALKGRLGRIVVRFPDAELAAGTHVQLNRDGQKVADRYGEGAWEVLPGPHDVLVMNACVPGCEVRAGHDTVLRTGMLALELGPETSFQVFPKGSRQRLFDRYGSATVGLPVGEYEVEIQKQRVAVTVREGQITRF